MNALLAFVLGLLVGWLIEWVIDWLYWRRKTVEKPTAVETGDRARIAELEQEVASYKHQLTSLQEQIRAHDNLEEIQGVTPEMARMLTKAGIYKFTDLGALRPQKLKELVGDCLQQPGGEVDIIRQARLTSGMIKKVDDLEVIVGIGPVIARILNEAGVFTFQELSSLSAKDLRAIVGERIERLANEDKILTQAKQLAESQSQGG